MIGHIHLGVWFIIEVALAMAIINPLMRVLAGHLSNTVIGRALAFTFG